jgi:hypothetical protein
MKHIQLIPVVHRNEMRLLVKFNYDSELTAIIRKVEGSTFSNTQKSWHVSNTPEKLNELFRVFKDVASIEVSADFDKTTSLNKNLIKNEIVQNTPYQKPNQVVLGPLSDEMKGELLKYKDWMRQKRYSASSIDTYTEA